jgi:hypothetical protein
MYLFPFPAQTGKFSGERHLDAPQFGRFEPVVLPHARRPVWATQIDDRAFPTTADVDVRGVVIIWVDHGAQAIEAEHGRHEDKSIKNRSAWLSDGSG